MDDDGDDVLTDCSHVDMPLHSECGTCRQSRLDSGLGEGQILALAFRQKSLKPSEMFPLRLEAGVGKDVAEVDFRTNCLIQVDRLFPS